MPGGAGMTRPMHLLLAALLLATPAARARTLCQGEAGLRAERSRLPVPLVFRNSGTAPMAVFWINFDGRRQFYAKVAPGGVYRVDSFADHPWVVTDTADNCLALLTPGMRGFDATIN